MTVYILEVKTTDSLQEYTLTNSRGDDCVAQEKGAAILGEARRWEASQRQCQEWQVLQLWEQPSTQGSTTPTETLTNTTTLGCRVSRTTGVATYGERSRSWWTHCTDVLYRRFKSRYSKRVVQSVTISLYTRDLYSYTRGFHTGFRWSLRKHNGSGAGKSTPHPHTNRLEATLRSEPRRTGLEPQPCLTPPGLPAVQRTQPGSTGPEPPPPGLPAVQGSGPFLEGWKACQGKLSPHLSFLSGFFFP